MTLIAYIPNHKIPFLMGDLLMSSRIGNEKLKLPTNNFEIAEFLPKDKVLKPHSLNQKTYIINENLCVALAGSELEMRNFLTELRTRSKIYDHKLGVRQVHEFLKEYNLESQFQESGFFLILIEKSGNGKLDVGLFNSPQNTIPIGEDYNFNGWSSLETEVYGNIQAFGSGKKSFLNLIGQGVKFSSSFEKEDPWNGMQSNVIMIARLLAIERVTVHTLKDNWGGGFESIYYNGTSFEKINEIAYIVNHGEFDKSGDIGLPIPRLILYYRYIDDVLFITALEINKWKRIYEGGLIKLSSASGDYDYNLFKVPSIERRENAEEIEDPSDLSFETINIGMGYSLITDTEGTFNPAFYIQTPEFKVKYNHKGPIELTLIMELTDIIRAKSKEAFPNIK